MKMNWTKLLSVLCLITFISNCGTERSKPVAKKGDAVTTTEQTANTNATVNLTYGEANYVQLSVAPFMVGEDTKYAVTFSTAKDEEGKWEVLTFTTRFSGEVNNNLLFVNHNLDVGRFDALNFCFELSTPDKETFEKVKNDLLSNTNAKNAILTISRVNEETNRVALLVLNEETIRKLQFEDVAKRFENTATPASINLFEMGTVYLFATKYGQEPVNFTPDINGWRSIVEELQPYTLK